MNKNHHESLSVLFSFGIILLTALIIHEFLIALVWAGILAIATWPIYKGVLAWTRDRRFIASGLLVVLFTVAIVLPLLWLTVIIASEIQLFTKFLLMANEKGVPFPPLLDQLPFGAEMIKSLWMKTLGNAHGIEKFLAENYHTSIKPLTSVVKLFGQQLAHRTVTLGFTIMCLFFFYKDGKALTLHINAMGNYFLGKRWDLYCKTLPSSINATVNGLVLVGIGVGIIMGISYAFTGVPAPALLGAFTGLLAMIPFGVPIAFALVALILLSEAKLFSALVIVLLGTVVMFIADHIVRPTIIGSATRLPFLAVLFGILGGVKTLGLVGLFIGPIVMVLFITLWHEADVLGT